MTMTSPTNMNTVFSPTPPKPPITIERVDFAKTKCPEYKGYYAVVLDNVLLKEECQQLVAAAESTTNGHWERAMVNTGGNTQALMPDMRNCGRIIWDDREIVAKIWDRVKPHVPEVEYVEQPIAGKYRVTRLNERMRFLKYGPDEYFNAHCDGTYTTPGGLERSFYTLHLYLNETDEENDLVGGATTFHSYSMVGEYNVYPKTGRVLLFQHRNLLHSGQAVAQGIKMTLRTDLMFERV